MNRYALLLILMIGSSSACDDSTRLFPEDRTYRHELFATIEDCQAFQNAGGINCSQSASFCRNGTANVVVTDIINPASYRIDRDILTVAFPTPSELSAPLRYRLSANEDTLILVSSATQWIRQPAVDPFACP